MTTQAWLLAYDIAHPRRLARVHRRMRQHATAIEYSVFWLEGTAADRLRCLQAVLPLLDRDVDDLRCYAMPARGLRLRLGRTTLPQGIIWSGLPAAFAWDTDDGTGHENVSLVNRGGKVLEDPLSSRRGGARGLRS